MVVIKGYENYGIDEAGQVYNMNTGRTLKPSVGAGGYYRVNLRKDGKTKTCYVHRLVAEAFVPNPQGLREVNHKDENKLNNCADNLEWVSHSQNINYATCQQRKGATNTQRNGRPIQCVETKIIYPSMTVLEKELGYNKGTVWQACNGKIKTAYGYHWQYVDDE